MIFDWEYFFANRSKEFRSIMMYSNWLNTVPLPVKPEGCHQSMLNVFETTENREIESKLVQKILFSVNQIHSDGRSQKLSFAPQKTLFLSATSIR